jgi:hypothetical protein
MLAGYNMRGSWPDEGPEYDDTRHTCAPPVWDEIEDLWKDDWKQEVLKEREAAAAMAQAQNIAIIKMLEALQSPPRDINQEAKNA